MASSSEKPGWKPSTRLLPLLFLTMLAFAGNSLLCRLALSRTAIDPASFTAVRLASGALFLWLVVRFRSGSFQLQGDWASALALFLYAAGFSYAYRELSTGTGALLLFAAVQATMVGYGLWIGDRFTGYQIIGLALACGGLIFLLLPGLRSPSPGGALFMLLAGASWGTYSLRGGSGNPTMVTAGNFLRAALIALVLLLAMCSRLALDLSGCGYAVASGAFASGAGYILWYSLLPQLNAIRAASVQLGVPVLAAMGGILLLNEPLSLRLAVASGTILCGITMVLGRRRIRQTP